MSEYDGLLLLLASFSLLYIAGEFWFMFSDLQKLKAVKQPEGPRLVVLSTGRMVANIHHIVRKVKERGW